MLWDYKKIIFQPKQNKMIMKSIILKYGSYSAIFLIVAGLIPFLFMGGSETVPEDYGKGEIIGYLTIVLSLVFVFFGIKKYRDEGNGGVITFGKALKMGALIILFPSFAFAVYNIIYVEVLDPDFADKYYEYQLDKMKADADPSEYSSIESSLADQKEMWANIPFQTALMFMTVYVIGFSVSLLSSLILSRKSSENISIDSSE